MFKLQIHEDQSKEGEVCWILSLIEDDGKSILQSETPLRKGEILALAKKIKHEVSNAEFFEQESEKPQKGIWFEVAPNKNDGLCLRLMVTDKYTMVSTATCSSKEDIENLLESIKDDLKQAKIVWYPPEEDPAREHKDKDRSQNRGIPGSL